METLVGSTLGSYKVKRLLGSGGMGTVYLAEDRAIGQQVAIKIVRTDYPEENYGETNKLSILTTRFRQEARAIASLDHLHILPLYHYGEEQFGDGARAYIVMQYRPEGSLLDWLGWRTGKNLQENSLDLRQPVIYPEAKTTAAWPLALEEVAEYLQQAASALQYAHEQGIVHRDVKPANFLLRFDSKQKYAFLLLSDFGLAKFFKSSTSRSRSVGTPLYMAPEQFAGTAGPACDQYALAVMIYYLLAGRPPFTGDPVQLMNLHLNLQPLPIRQLAPTLPSGVEMCLARALSKDPAKRYPTISDFADSFMQYASPTSKRAAQLAMRPFSLPIRPGEFSPVHAPITPRRPPFAPDIQQPIPQSAYMHNGYSPALAVEDEKAPVPRKRVMPPGALTLPTSAKMPALENVAGRFTASTLAPAPPLRRQQEEECVPSPPSLAHHLDRPVTRRRALAFIIGGAVVAGTGVGIVLYEHTRNTSQRASATSHIAYQLTGHRNMVTSVAWAPDSNLLASTSLDNTVRIWRPSKGQTITTYKGHRSGVEAVTWNSTGEKLASGGRDQVFHIWDLQGTTQYKSTNQGETIDALTWNDEQGSIFFGTQGNGAYAFQLESNQFLPFEPATFVRAVAVQPNGQYLAIGKEDGRVSLYSLRSQEAPIIYSPHTKGIRALAWSPDGTRLASSGKDKAVHVFDFATKQLSSSMKNTSVINGLAWDPRNTGRIALAAGDGALRLWEIGTGTQISYQGHTGALTSVTWSTQGLATGSLDKTIIVWNL